MHACASAKLPAYLSPKSPHCNPKPNALNLAQDRVAHVVLELGAHARANIAHARISTGDGTEGSLFKFDFDFGAHPVAAELDAYGQPAGIQDPTDNLKRRMSRSHLFGVDDPEATDTGKADLRNKWCAGNRTHPPTRAQSGPHPFACLDHAGEPLAAYTGTLVFSQHVVSSGDLPFYDVDNLLRDSPYIASQAQWYVYIIRHIPSGMCIYPVVCVYYTYIASKAQWYVLSGGAGGRALCHVISTDVSLRDACRFSENMGGGAGAAVKTPKAAMVTSVLTAYACWAGTENQPPRFVRTLDTPPTLNGSVQCRPDASGMPPLVLHTHALIARLRNTGTSPRRRRRNRRRL